MFLLTVSNPVKNKTTKTFYWGPALVFIICCIAITLLQSIEYEYILSIFNQNALVSTIITIICMITVDSIIFLIHFHPFFPWVSTINLNALKVPHPIPQVSTTHNYPLHVNLVWIVFLMPFDKCVVSGKFL